MDFHAYIDSSLKPSVKLRIDVERRIVDEIAKALFALDFVVRINDGEEYVTKRTTDPETVQRAICSTDEDLMVVYRANEKENFGWIHFVYGNDGFDVVHDHTDNLSHVIDPILKKYG